MAPFSRCTLYDGTPFFNAVSIMDSVIRYMRVISFENDGRYVNNVGENAPIMETESVFSKERILARSLVLSTPKAKRASEINIHSATEKQHRLLH